MDHITFLSRSPEEKGVLKKHTLPITQFTDPKIETKVLNIWTRGLLSSMLGVSTIHILKAILLIIAYKVAACFERQCMLYVLE